MRAEADVVIVGAGGGGLAAALAASDEGADVLLIDSAPVIGGTYAYSTGLIWCPATTRMLEGGLADSREEGAAHIRALSGGKHDDAILEAYLDGLPRELDYLEQRHGVPYEIVPRYPDYYAEREGGKTEGRYIASPVFDTRELPAEWRSRLARSPIYDQTPASWKEIQDWGGFGTVARWDWDLIDRRREQQVMGFGSATIGYLLRAALEAGVEIAPSTPARRLIMEDGRVAGVVVADGSGAETEVRAPAVILTSGAFDWNDRMHHQLDPHQLPTSVGMPTVDGSGIVMALEQGAAYAVVAGQILIPTFHIPGEEYNGKPLWRLFVREPAFPGGVIVNQQGQRFCDESFYRAIIGGMTRFDLVSQSYPNGRAFFVFDEEWKRKYSLGSVRPGQEPEWLASGDLSEVSASLGIPEDALARTLEDFNEGAERGEDPAFGRGGTIYGRNNGDQDVSPNPCVRPLEGKLFAIEIRPGTVGGSGGLYFDPSARVLDWHGEPIPGLYCAGNVGANIVEGLWYNSGLANGRALGFGCAAGRTAVADAGLAGRTP
jgi:3-oxosteroid 1-dehydrogenase